jgi:hypothetical protein
MKQVKSWLPQARNYSNASQRFFVNTSAPGQLKFEHHLQAMHRDGASRSFRNTPFIIPIHFFGQWTYGGKGMTPREKRAGKGNGEGEGQEQGGNQESCCGQGGKEKGSCSTTCCRLVRKQRSATSLIPTVSVTGMKTVQSPTPWRFSRRMKYSQDLNPSQAGPDPIRNDVPGIRHNQFAGAMNTARMAKGRVFG